MSKAVHMDYPRRGKPNGVGGLSGRLTAVGFKMRVKNISV